MCSTPRSVPRRSGWTSPPRRGCCAPRRSSPTGRCPGSTRRPSTASPCAASTCAPRPRSPSSCPWWARSRSGSRQAHRLQPGQAVRVATGAPLPTLADAVAPHDHTDAADDPGSRGTGHRARLTVKTPVPSAAWVRRVGEDVAPGDVAVRRGATVGPAQVGLLAAVGPHQGARAPPPARVGDGGRRRARRPRPHAGHRPGRRRQLLRAGRRGRRRGRRGDAPAHRLQPSRRRCARRSSRRSRARRSSSSPGGVGGRLGEDVQDTLSPSSGPSTSRAWPCTPAPCRASAGSAPRRSRRSCCRRTRCRRSSCSRCSSAR